MAFVVSVGRVGCRRRGLVMTGGEGLPPPTSPFAAGGKVSPFGVGAEGSLASSKAMKVDVATEKNKALIDWLRVHGVYMEDRSTWGKAPHALVVTNESTDEGEPCGRGLLAKRDINQGEPVFEIPEELCMTKRKAVKHLGLSEELNEYLAIGAYLISERAKGESSFYFPYLSVLPEDKDLNPMFRWSKEELEALKGSPSLAACLSLKMKVKAEFEMMDRDVFSLRRDVFPEDLFTLEAWEWAFAVLFSRAILFDPQSYEDQELALVPYADLLNHNPFCSAFIERQKRLFSKNKFVVVYADRNYTKMEQVYTTYGQKSNAELLILYGFVVDRNPYDSIDLTVSLDANDPLYERKESYLKSVGKPTSIEFPLYTDRSPVEMIEFLRFCVADESELEVGIFNRMVTVRNEILVAETLIQAATDALNGYPTTLDEDNKLMGDRKLYRMLDKNTRMAVKLRRSEKRILTRTINDIQRRLTVPEKIFA